MDKRNSIGIAFILACAAIPLFGNDLPEFTWAILITVFCLAALRFVIDPNTFPSLTAQDLGAAAFFLFAFSSLLYTTNIRLTETSLVWLAVCLAVYFFARLMSSRDVLLLLNKVLVWVAVVTVLYEIYKYVTVGNEGYPFIFSTFFNKNIYGAFLVSILPLIFLGKKPQFGVELILCTLYGMIIIAGLVLTFSRSAWLLAAVLLVVIGLVYLRRRYYSGLLALVLGVFIGGCLGLVLDKNVNQSMIKRFSVAWSKAQPGKKSYFEGQSVQPRLVFWRSAWKIGAETPVLGKGYGTFATTHVRLMRWPTYSKYAHNYILGIFAELGLAGLAIFLFILGSSAFIWFKGVPDKHEMELRFPYYLAALMVLAHACADITLDIPEGALWFWLLLGIGSQSIKGNGVFLNKWSIWRIMIYVLTSASLIAAGILQYRQETIAHLTREAMVAESPRSRADLIFRALRLRPGDDKLLAARAASNQALGQLALAVEDYTAAAKADINNPFYQIDLAYTLLRMGRKEEAEKAAEEAMRINATLPQVIEGYGKVLYATGQYQPGIANLAKAAQIENPADRWQRVLSLARAYVLAGDLKEAERALEYYAAFGENRVETLRLYQAEVALLLDHYDQAYRALAAIGTISGEERKAFDRIRDALRAKGYKAELLDQLAPVVQ